MQRACRCPGQYLQKPAEPGGDSPLRPASTSSVGHVGSWVGSMGWLCVWVGAWCSHARQLPPCAEAAASRSWR